MSVSIFSITENFITKFTFVFLLIHNKLVNLEKKPSNTHVHVFSTVVKFKMVILIFKIESEKEMGKCIDVMECFTCALLDVTI